MITYSLCCLCIKKFLSYSTDCSCSSQVGRQRRPPAGQWPATETDSGQSAWRWLTSVWQFLRNRYRSIALLICRLTGKGEMELLETPIVSFFLRYMFRFEYGSANTTHPLFPWCLSLRWAAALGECRCACGGSAVVCSWYLKALCSYWRRTQTSLWITSPLVQGQHDMWAIKEIVHYFLTNLYCFFSLWNTK